MLCSTTIRNWYSISAYLQLKNPFFKPRILILELKINSFTSVYIEKSLTNQDAITKPRKRFSHAPIMVKLRCKSAVDFGAGMVVRSGGGGGGGGGFGKDDTILPTATADLRFVEIVEYAVSKSENEDGVSVTSSGIVALQGGMDGGCLFKRCGLGSC